MESFDVYFFFTCIRLNKKELYKAAIIKKQGEVSQVYNIIIEDRYLQNHYGPLNLVRKHNDWIVEYSGDIDLFNLKMEISNAIEMYESYSNEYIID